MLNNILIFRTDRVGDLIVTCPAIITIKEYLVNPKITIITSEKNYKYAKDLKIFDEILIYPKKGFIKRTLFTMRLARNKFQYIFIFDGKERSVITSFFIKSKFKVALLQSIKFYHKLSKIKFFEDTEKTNLTEIFQKMLNYCSINTDINNYDFIKLKKDNNFSKKLPIDRYMHIHLDEKWFSNLYIKSYTNINPQYDDFIDFINSISIHSDIIITTGVTDTSIIDQLKEKFFKKIDEKIFHMKNSGKSIYLIYKPSFEDIESLLRKAKTLIACHGSVTHVANSLGVKKIDILEENKIEFYKRFTSYLKNYCPIYRSNFTHLKILLLKAIKE